MQSPIRVRWWQRRSQAHQARPGRTSAAIPKAASSNFMWFMLGSFSTALVGLALPNSAQNRQTPNSPVVEAAQPETTAKNAAKAKAVEPTRKAVTVAPSDNTPTVDAATAPDSSGRRPLGFYVSGVRSTLFSAPQPPAPPKAKSIKIKSIVQPPAPPLPVINPFADWAYTGTVKIGEQVMALMENTKTKEGQYVKVGESFLGAQVSSITDQMITLTSMGKPNQIAKSSNITVTPLDKNAGAAGGGQPNQPAPGGAPAGGPPPNMPPPMPEMMGGAPPGVTFTPGLPMRVRRR